MYVLVDWLIKQQNEEMIYKDVYATARSQKNQLDFLASDDNPDTLGILETWKKGCNLWDTVLPRNVVVPVCSNNREGLHG